MTKPLQLNYLVEEIEDSFVGHCLELSLVATGLTKGEVLGKLEKMAFCQVAFAVENNRIRDVFKPAPADIWERWLKARDKNEQPSQHVRADSQTLVTLNQTAHAAGC